MLLRRLCAATVFSVRATCTERVTSRSASLRTRRACSHTASTMKVALDPGVAKAVVLYHYPCPDGVFAALAAHLYHSAVGCPVHFLPNSVFQPLTVKDLNVEGVDVFYLLDFAGPQSFAVDLAHKAKQVIVLDHHKTALETLPRNGEGPQNLLSVLDMSRSGATVAYDYFQEKLQTADLKKLPPSLIYSRNPVSQSVNLLSESKLQRVRALFKYIEDADLWKWKLPDSKAFSSGLSDIGLEFSYLKNPGIFEQLLELDTQDLICRGRESLKSKQAVIDGVLVESFRLALGGGQFGHCLAVRADDSAHLRSELGNQLAAKSLTSELLPIGAVIYVQPGYEGTETQFKVSLRSIGESADTTKISQAYGGGGHRNASSFLISREELERWKS
ncbi:uncharacterized protein MPTK2_4g04030 [Marchantia polymorpha subsp. ruderalis]